MLKFKSQQRCLTTPIQMLFSNKRKTQSQIRSHIPIRTNYHVKEHIHQMKLQRYQKNYRVKTQFKPAKEENEKQQQSEQTNQEKKQDKEEFVQSSDMTTNFIKLIGITGLFYLIFTRESTNPFIDEYEFWNLQNIQRITIKQSHNELIAVEDNLRIKVKIKNFDQFLQQLEKNFPNVSVSFDYESLEIHPNQMTAFLNLAFLGIMGYWLYLGFNFYKKNIKSGKELNFGGDMFGFGKLKNAQLDKKNINFKFSDVAGQTEAKQEIEEFVDFLKNPQKYRDLGAKLPKGALLVGPPGTGKTLLAKACAGEADVPFFYLSGSDFVEMFVGVGASRVRDLFKQAKQKSPSIIFIDEIDAIGRKRESKLGGNDERDTTLNQLLVEMDGFGTYQNVIVMAATNRAELLDPALTRPGRFDRQIEVTLPTQKDRQQILKLHLQPIKLSKNLDVETLSKRLSSLTPGFSGADLANLCNEAAIHAARSQKDGVFQSHFESAQERITLGLKLPINESQQKQIAFHEAGHAVVSYFLKTGSPVLKISIQPRSKNVLGHTQFLNGESGLRTEEFLKERITVLLGGRVSEKFFLDSISTGAHDDLQKVYSIAKDMVQVYGMAGMPYIGYPKDELKRGYSNYVEKMIDDKIQMIVKESEQQALEIIESKKEIIEKLVAWLIEHGEIGIQELIEIMGERDKGDDWNEIQKVSQEVKEEIKKENLIHFISKTQLD